MLESLIKTVKEHFETLEDPRIGENTTYEFADVCMAGYSVFHMQSSSFLAHQERLNRKHAAHNGETLFGFKKIPSDNQIRNLLDTVAPEKLSHLFETLHEHIDNKEFSTQGGLVVALDGTSFFSSSKISCECCSKRTYGEKTRYFHFMLMPALIHPEQKCALPMMPEFVTPQDGEEKQDCELNAAKRWCDNHQSWLSRNKVTLLGDDLFSHAPFIKQLKSYENVRFLLVAKPTSHKYLQEWISGYSKEDIQTSQRTEKKGSQKRVYTYKMFKNIPLNADAKSLLVDYFEMEVHDTKGKMVYRNSFVTNHDITTDNVHQIAQIGRDRWKIENEAFNILKTKGYNLEHNFGHGKKNLANTLASLNLLAFLVHHLAQTLDDAYKKVRGFFGARVRFFQTLSAALSFHVFSSWNHLMSFIIEAYGTP